MRQLIIILLFGLAIWYGWKQYPKMVERRPSHLAVFENQTDAPITSVRIKVDGQTLTKDGVEPGKSVTLPFRVSRDATFDLIWNDPSGERTWSGGMVPAGPMVQRHVFVIDSESQVLYRPENR
jgi:hypothetical protein